LRVKSSRRGIKKVSNLEGLTLEGLSRWDREEIVNSSQIGSEWGAEACAFAKKNELITKEMRGVIRQCDSSHWE
jgi:hypothetical protein